MTYEVIFSRQFEKSMEKLKSKDKVLFSRIKKKTAEIIENPARFKPLKNALAGRRRIHFGSFILVFRIENNAVHIISLDHHDNAY
ncbi:MAG: type II toxin-antitoxin system mRNA interferase toxin, RelE/StbE family [Candidatus Micrarchaeota archaeon]